MKRRRYVKKRGGRGGGSPPGKANGLGPLKKELLSRRPVPSRMRGRVSTIWSWPLRRIARESRVLALPSVSCRADPTRRRLLELAAPRADASGVHKFFFQLPRVGRFQELAVPKETETSLLERLLSKTLLFERPPSERLYDSLIVHSTVRPVPSRPVPSRMRCFISFTPYERIRFISDV